MNKVKSSFFRWFSYEQSAATCETKLKHYIPVRKQCENSTTKARTEPCNISFI